MDVEYFKERFKNIESSYLLQRRAHGEELAPNAHIAIEQILSERGETFPPIPQKPIDITIANEPRRGKFAVFGWIAFILLGTAMGRAFEHTLAGTAIALCLTIYYVCVWIRRQMLSKEKRAAEDDARRAENEGLNEMMKCAANGDVKRIVELVAYGVNVNTTTSSGTTALMYAARNGHSTVVQYLLENGADRDIKTDKGSRALDFAKKFNHSAVVSLLS